MLFSATETKIVGFTSFKTFQINYIWIKIHETSSFGGPLGVESERLSFKLLKALLAVESTTNFPKTLIVKASINTTGN